MLTLRENLNRPLTIEEMDGNFIFLSGSITPGVQGPQGPQGPAGKDGADGATGPQGNTGPAGNDGADGATGPQGIQGAEGPQGPQGIQGPAGDEWTYQLGEYVSDEGGVIFHRYKESGQEKYLIVDITDVSVSSVYSDIDNVQIGPPAKSTWDGSSNTTAIVNQFVATSGAAFLCDASTNGGQNDWYLPAIDELNLIWNNRFNINKTLSGVGGADTISFNYYWSSTEANASNAYNLNFLNGDANFSSKDDTYRVRAVRDLTI